MNHIIVKKNILKVTIASLASLLAFNVAAEDGAESWGSPVATFSNVSLGSGSEGVDINATFGGYLSGVYKHRLEFASKEDMDHYEVNYLLFNSVSESGITIDSTWSEDVEYEDYEGSGKRHYYDVNSVDAGLFSKLVFPDPNFTAFPKMSVGYMWGDSIVDTTYVDLEVAVRYSFKEMFWVGVTPVFTHSMEGIEIDEFSGSIEGGIKLSETFGISASYNDDDEFIGNVIFAF